MEVLLCPSKQRRNILSVIYGRTASHLVSASAEFCSRFTLKNRITRCALQYKYSYSEYQTHSVEGGKEGRERKKKLPFIMSNFLVISHLFEKACWFIYKQNTHVSSRISPLARLLLSATTFSKQLSLERGWVGGAWRGMWTSSVCSYLQRGLFSHSTHTLVTPGSAYNISGGT